MCAGCARGFLGTARGQAGVKEASVEERELALSGFEPTGPPPDVDAALRGGSAEGKAYAAAALCSVARASAAAATFANCGQLMRTTAQP